MKSFNSGAKQSRRRFKTPWDEIKYLYHKVLYWLYDRQERRHALPFCERLQTLLADTDPQHESILGEECLSLIYEAKKDLPKAIHHREEEIKRIKQLWKSAAHAGNRDIILESYGPPDLSDRLDLLAILWRDAGDEQKSIRLLRESQRLCEEHGIPFDGEDLLQEFAIEKGEVIGSNLAGSSSRAMRRK
jgi:hypothetical protein